MVLKRTKSLIKDLYGSSEYTHFRSSFSPNLVPTSAAEGLHLVPISLKISSSLGPHSVWEQCHCPHQRALELSEKCGLKLQSSKCEVFSWTGVLPASCPEDLSLAGQEVDGAFQPGFLCVGVPV